MYAGLGDKLARELARRFSAQAAPYGALPPTLFNGCCQSANADDASLFAPQAIAAKSEACTLSLGAPGSPLTNIARTSSPRNTLSRPGSEPEFGMGSFLVRPHMGAPQAGI